MKNISYFALVIFLFAASVFAASPPEIGRYRGLAFSSATSRHSFEIEGGSFVRCKTDPASHSDITQCDVEKGSLVVAGAEGNQLNVKFSRVSLLRSKAVRNYYYRGVADLTIGAKRVNVPVRITLTLEDATPGKLRGFIDLPDQSARTSIEAYLVN